MDAIRGAIYDLRGHNDSGQYSNHTSHHSNQPDKKRICIDDSKANRAHEGAIGMTAGSYIANVANKIKHKVDGENKKEEPYSHHLGSAKHYGGGGNNGPHNSNMLNKLDPRVDSSRNDKIRNQAFARTTYYYPRDGNTTTGSHDTSPSKQV